jgi:hypothetical protein
MTFLVQKIVIVIGQLALTGSRGYMLQSPRFSFFVGSRVSICAVIRLPKD